nr:reverse transcriptase domain-containing protein [Tanacetum cinerariifolium]
MWMEAPQWKYSMNTASTGSGLKSRTKCSRSLPPYNVIIGRYGIREIQAVPSTTDIMLKFPVEGGIITIRSTILIPTECTSVITSSAVSKEEGIRFENFKVALHPDFHDQEVAIGGTLSAKGRTELCSILKKKLDIFAWQLSDMTGVLRSVAEHQLNIREGYSPVRQKKIGQAPERAKAIQAEIQLAEPDEEKTAFHTRQGVYCYTKMPFGFKNAGATYQRLVDKAFDNQIGRNVEVYVDDLVVKSYTEVEMLRDIDETFRTLRKINMKLNPKKSAVLQLPSPRTIKEVQSLNGKLASLNRFLSKSAEKSLLLFKTLKNITYRPRTSVKGQILADFLIEMSDENPPAAPVAETQQEPRTLFTNGSSCVDGSGAGLILTNPGGIEFTYALRFQFAASNNEAEYEALIAGLRIAVRMGVQNVHVSVDSKLVANQVIGTYVAKEENMIKYLDKVKSLNEVTTVVEEDGPTWMTPIVEYLKEGTLPSDRMEARKLRIKARQYELLEGILYRRSFLTPWLRRVGPLQAEYVRREIHEGSCSMHAGPRSVVAKAIRLGYYWPTMHRDARDMIRKCNDCQIHRPMTRNPQQPLTPITAPWPFYK